jgi:hypothetical protein
METNQDQELIRRLGGPTALARLLGYQDSRRVHNWIKRGIPASIKLAYPKIFLKAKK